MYLRCPLKKGRDARKQASLRHKSGKTLYLKGVTQNACDTFVHIYVIMYT